jgi:raffinose/stachyose/melibiose transport system permease protein
MTTTVQVPRAAKRSSLSWYSLRRQASRALLYGGLLTWATMTVYPFYWLVINSLKRTWDVFNDPFGLPTVWVFRNYLEAWQNARIGIMTQRSLFVTILSTIMAVLLASTTSFVLSRFHFRWKNVLMAYLMLGFMVPETIRLLPLAIFTRQIGIYDTLWGLSLVYAAGRLPFNAFILTAFMEKIPRELEEAAVMDGANMWRVFWNVIFPLSQPGIVTVATFHALSVWSEFIMAFVLIGSFNNRTLAVGVVSLIGQYFTNYVVLFAASVLAIIPAVIFFVLLQNYVVKGMSAGALQGV